MDAKLQTLKAKIDQTARELNAHRRSSNAYESAQSAMAMADRAAQFGLGEIVSDGLATALAEVSTPEYGEFLRKDEEISGRYNALVREYNAIVKAKKNARDNEREAAKIRAAMCDKCFTVHRPEVECF